jgi:anti-sigma regulatory factor (Ser/Thr protein kinase)
MAEVNVGNTRRKRATSSRSRAIERFVLREVRWHQDDLVSHTARHFRLTHEGARKHVARLVAEGHLEAHGTTRARRYSLVEQELVAYSDVLSSSLEEHRIWMDVVEPVLPSMGGNARRIIEYGFHEMVNNAIEHSGGKRLRIAVRASAVDLEVTIGDDGVGVFERLRQGLSLPSLSDAAVELAKGKTTTDPARHTGEGIFFTSRAVDEFGLQANAMYWFVKLDVRDVLLEPGPVQAGTEVSMRVGLETTRSLVSVFERFQGEDSTFSRTRVPVIVTRVLDQGLVSRSAARRLLARLERFEEVCLDFTGVKSIGQAFADEIFRVYVREHPEVRITPLKMSKHVRAMVDRAQAEARAGER